MKEFWEFPPEAQQLVIETQVAPTLGSDVRTITAKIDSGYSSDIYVLHGENIFPASLVIKTPKTLGCVSEAEAKKRIGGFESEIKVTTRLSKNAWAQEYKRVIYFCGWPFAVARLRDGTLRDLIENPANWSIEEKVISAIQITRGLSQCYECGVSAHQELKPENIFFNDLRRLQTNTLPFHVYIADFGAANGVNEVPPRNFGSRPYMAPEQYGSEVIANPESIDVFALAVIVCEILSDGVHPSGIRTADVWPASKGKYARETFWKKWANDSKKLHETVRNKLSKSMEPVLEMAMSSSVSDRPSIKVFESYLWSYLEEISSRAEDVDRLIEAFEGMYFDNLPNGYMQEHLASRYGDEVP